MSTDAPTTSSTIEQARLPLPVETAEEIFHCYGQELISLCERAQAEGKRVVWIDARGRYYKVGIRRMPLRSVSSD